jgi:hypothetical protein
MKAELVEGESMELKRPSKPLTEAAPAADVAGLIEIDTKLARHAAELPHKISDLIEQDKELAATDSDNLSLVQVQAHDKTHTETANHFARISKLRIIRTLRTATLESRSRRAK